MIPPKNKIDPKALRNLNVQHDYNAKYESRQPTLEHVLAIDYGQKFSGLAYNPLPGMAAPLFVIPTADFHTQVMNVLEQKNIQRIVWGLPISSDGTENEICQAIRHLADQYNAKGYPGVFVNERHTTQSIVTKEGKTRQDDLAAARILEFYFQGSML